MDNFQAKSSHLYHQGTLKSYQITILQKNLVPVKYQFAHLLKRNLIDSSIDNVDIGIYIVLAKYLTRKYKRLDLCNFVSLPDYNKHSRSRSLPFCKRSSGSRPNDPPLCVNKNSLQHSQSS